MKEEIYKNKRRSISEERTESLYFIEEILDEDSIEEFSKKRYHPGKPSTREEVIKEVKDFYEENFPKI